MINFIISFTVIFNGSNPRGYSKFSYINKINYVVISYIEPNPN